LGAHRREKGRREDSGVPGHLLGHGGGSRECPLTRERVIKAVGGEAKERATSIEKNIGLLLFFPLSMEAKRWHGSLL
jgi:hypothetical protein